MKPTATLDREPTMTPESEVATQRVLVVDDEKSISALLLLALKRYEWLKNLNLMP